MSSQDFLSYDSVIPMSMWFDPNLDPLDVKMYAIIRSLSNKVGYCFATNEYLAKTSGLGDRTIQRHLVVLKKNGYLEIETNKNGIHWQRRIYISDKFKKSLRSDSCDTPPRHECHPPMTQMSPITKSYTNEENSKGDYVVADASRLSDLLFASVQKTKPDIPPQNLIKWSSIIHRMLTLDKRDMKKIEAVIEWLPSSEFWSKNILSADKLRKQFDRLELEMATSLSKNKGKATANESQTNENKKLAQKIIDKFPNEAQINHIQMQTNSLLFCYTGCWDEIIFTDLTFRDKTLARLVKMNLSTEGI